MRKKIALVFIVFIFTIILGALISKGAYRGYKHPNPDLEDNDIANKLWYIKTAYDNNKTDKESITTEEAKYFIDTLNLKNFSSEDERYAVQSFSENDKLFYIEKIRGLYNSRMAAKETQRSK